MPRPSASTLLWTPELACYELWSQSCYVRSFRAGDEASWLAWLEAHAACSFHGQNGYLNMHKETRQRGNGYWYAYRSQGKRTVKRYLGPTARITLARLEEIAGQLEHELTGRGRGMRSATADGTGTQTARNDPPTLSGQAWPDEGALAFPLPLRFHPPRLRTNLVERARLIQLLEDSREQTLILLSAPAGSGKTTVTCQWLASFQGERPWLAWITLDKNDNNAVRFWRSVASACREIAGVHIRTVLEQLAFLERSPSPVEMPVLELVITSFLQALASVQHRIIVVLDDYHFLTEPQIHTSLIFWLENLPSHIQVIILTRHDPPLPLARWRVHGLLREIRSSEMRFTSDETTRFFQQTSKHTLDAQGVMLLQERTEGWAAGLQLAALFLNTHGPGELTRHVFHGGHRYIAEYLVQEVFHRLPENVQIFLLQTSLLEQLQGRLCEAVTQQPEGQSMLEWLEHANLFLLPLDDTRQWYRYHHLFREMLFQLLQQRRPAEIAALHGRAARWFMQEHMATLAATHTHAAGDFAMLADIIEQFEFEMIQRGEHATLISWIGLLPQTVVLERLPIFALLCREMMAVQRTQAAAELLYTYAHLHQLPIAHAGNAGELERACCKHVERRFPPEQFAEEERTTYVSELLALYAALVLIQERNITLYQQIQHCSERYPSRFARFRGYEKWFVTLLQGDIHGAIADLTKRLERSGALREDAILFAYIYPVLSYLLTATGQLGEVRRIARSILQVQDRLDARLNHGPALIDLGAIAYEENQLEQAEASIQAGLSLCKYQGTEPARCKGFAILAKIKHAQGDDEAALAIIQEFESFLNRNNLQADTLNICRGLLARTALDLGDTSYARRWLQNNPIPQDFVARATPLHEQIYLTQALFLLRCECRAEARTLLCELNRLARRWKLHGTRMIVLALQALCMQEENEDERSITMLQEALTLAEASNYLRTFLDLGADMQALLLSLWKQRRASTGARSSSAAEKLLERLINAIKAGQQLDTALASADVQALIDPLSARELEILHLVCAGRANREIAHQLVIAVSTVKSHLNTIYGKLQVQSRTQAIVRARALGLC